jgi:thymidylate synthase ThyX
LHIRIIKEVGFEEGILGLSLSRNQSLDKMPNLAFRLSDKDGGHNKFLEFIPVWLDIQAPRYFWQQMATYRIGNSWQSESTMYTILNRELNQDDFEKPIFQELLDLLNNAIRDKDFEAVKSNLPESYLQRRIMISNYKALRNIILQRQHHKLKEWHFFCNEVLSQLEHPEFIIKDYNKGEQS